MSKKVSWKTSRPPDGPVVDLIFGSFRPGMLMMPNTFYIREIKKKK